MREGQNRYPYPGSNYGLSPKRTEETQRLKKNTKDF